MKNMEYVNQKIGKEEYEIAEAYIKNNPELGYKNPAEYIIDAILHAIGKKN